MRSISGWRAIFKLSDETDSYQQRSTDTWNRTSLGDCRDTRGVGDIGVQLARALGCQVATTVGTNEDFDLVRRLRADEVINFREEKIEAYVERLTSGFGFDVVFDTVGGKNLIASMGAARTNGRLVTTNAPVTVDLTTAHSKALSLHGVFMMLPLITASDEKAMENVCDTLHSSLTVTACIPCCVAMTRSSSSAFAMKNMAFLPLSPRAS